MTYPSTYGTLYGLTLGQAVPSRLTWLGIAAEQVPGSPVLPVAAVPVNLDGYEPEDILPPVFDTGVRSSMGVYAGAVPGVASSAHAYSAPLYPDTATWWLDNLLGDHSAVTGGTLGTAAALALPVNAGDTALYTTVPIGPVAVGQAVQIFDGAASELVIATQASAGTAVFFASTPCRFAHGTTAIAAPELTSGVYVHTFAALNAGTGQPPTHTLTDTTGLTSGTGARCYPGVVVTQMDFAGDPGQGWVTGKVSGTAWPSQPSAATTTYPVTGYVPPFGGWQATVTVNGAIPYAGAWTATIKRQAIVYRNPLNGQAPWVIARGGLDVAGTLAYPAPADETPLLQLLSGNQPSVQIALSNGIYAFTLTCPLVAFGKSKPDRERTALAYGNAWQALDSAAAAGGSGGLSPVTVTVANGVAALVPVPTPAPVEALLTEAGGVITLENGLELDIEGLAPALGQVLDEGGGVITDETGTEMDAEA